jgi:hypothetical protein
MLVMKKEREPHMCEMRGYLINIDIGNNESGKISYSQLTNGG